MDQTKDILYYKGYTAGYRKGVRDTLSGKITTVPKKDIASLPLEVMNLSTRANNSLSRAGCFCIADVAALNEQTIAAMRNMGAKTAAEIARWLDRHQIHYTAWEKYL